MKVLTPGEEITESHVFVWVLCPNTSNKTSKSPFEAAWIANPFFGGPFRVAVDSGKSFAGVLKNGKQQNSKPVIRRAAPAGFFGERVLKPMLNFVSNRSARRIGRFLQQIFEISSCSNPESVTLALFGG